MALALSDIWVLLSVGSVLITPVHSEVRLNYHLDFMEFFGVAISARLLGTAVAGADVPLTTCPAGASRGLRPGGWPRAHTHTHT